MASDSHDYVIASSPVDVFAFPSLGPGKSEFKGSHTDKAERCPPVVLQFLQFIY